MFRFFMLSDGMPRFTAVCASAFLICSSLWAPPTANTPRCPLLNGNGSRSDAGSGDGAWNRTRWSNRTFEVSIENPLFATRSLASASPKPFFASIARTTSVVNSVTSVLACALAACFWTSNTSPSSKSTS